MKIKKFITKKIGDEEVKIYAKSFSLQDAAYKVLDEEKGIFEAYVSVFGNVDSYGEVVEKGAFKEWLTLHAGRYPKGVWAHDWAEPIIKTLEIREDDHGLYVKGQFVLEVQRAREIYALMKEGVITDFSFGFRVQEDTWDEVAKVRRLKKIAIYEYSPVLVGANDQATVLNVKSADGSETPVEQEEVVEDEVVPATEDTPTPGEGDEPTPPVADQVVGDDEGGSGDSAPTSEEAKPDSDEGKSGVALSRKVAFANAIDALKKATDALEALNEATEDEADEKASDITSPDATHEAKDSNTMRVVKAVLRDARKADKIIEKVILRAKEITK